MHVSPYFSALHSVTVYLNGRRPIHIPLRKCNEGCAFSQNVLWSRTCQNESASRSSSIHGEGEKFKSHTETQTLKHTQIQDIHIHMTQNTHLKFGSAYCCSDKKHTLFYFNLSHLAIYCKTSHFLSSCPRLPYRHSHQ